MDEARAVASHSSGGRFFKKKKKKKGPVLVCSGLNLNKRSFSGERLLPLQGVKVGLLLHSLGACWVLGADAGEAPSFSGKVRWRVPVALWGFSSYSG